MCGIAGIFSFDVRPVAEEELQRLCRTIAHRGPDDAGTYAGEGVGLAAVRLAIIDVSPAGHQPMASDDGRYVMVYNGEVYNFRELAGRARAQRPPLPLAHRHRGRAARVSGVGRGRPRAARRHVCLRDLGRLERRLFLARDRFGVKPLYYADGGSRFIFGSEVKAILEAGHRAEVNPAALCEYFTFQNVFSDQTLFAGVRMLPAGHSLVVTESGVEMTRYWDFEPEPGREPQRERVDRAAARGLPTCGEQPARE